MAAIDFKSVFAGISRAAYYHVAHGLEGIEHEFGAFNAEHLCHHLLCLWSLHGYLSVLVRHVGGIHVISLEML